MNDTRACSTCMVVGDLFIELVMSGFASWPPHAGEELFAEKFLPGNWRRSSNHRSGLAKLSLKVGVVGVVGDTDGQWLIDRLDDSRREYFRDSTKFAGAHSCDREYLQPARSHIFHLHGSKPRTAGNIATIASRGEFAKARHVHLALRQNPRR